MEKLVPLACPVNDEVLFRHDVEDLSILPHEIAEGALQILAFAVQNVLQRVVAVLIVQPHVQRHIETQKLSP